MASGLDHPGSDIDLRVDLPVGTSLLQTIEARIDIEDALGVKIDLCMEEELTPGFRCKVLAEAHPT